MRTMKVAVIQMAMVDDRAANLLSAERLIREAAAQGAQVVVLPELFESPYFCQDHAPQHFQLALAIDDNPAVRRLSALAGELSVVLPVSVFERAGNVFFNTVVMIDADGRRLGIYRKSHIPESPGYHEKHFFSPGDTGFKVWATRYGRIGVGICWDQWFPEAARVMALGGAELLVYPTAIGSEPQAVDLDSRDHWMRVMQGHAAANIVPVVAANRYGRERGALWELNFYGSSLMTDHVGAVVQVAERSAEQVLVQEYQLSAIDAYRRQWGVFRDRRPDLYSGLLHLAPDLQDTLS